MRIEKDLLSVTTSVNLSEVSKLTTFSEKIAVAEFVLENVGFSEASVATMSSSEKLALIGGTELVSTLSTNQYADSTTSSYANWSTILTYARYTTNRYYFTVEVDGVGAAYNWANSICVQGFAIDYSTARLFYNYWTTDSSGNHLSNKNGYYRYTELPNFFYEVSDAAGSGIGCKFNTEPAPYVDSSSSVFRLSCYGDNSNVNTPGGSFNIFGNSQLIPGFTPIVSLSYPAGFSVTSGGSTPIDCKTRLLTTIF